MHSKDKTTIKAKTTSKWKRFRVKMDLSKHRRHCNSFVGFSGHFVVVVVVVVVADFL